MHSAAVRIRNPINIYKNGIIFDVHFFVYWLIFTGDIVCVIIITNYINLLFSNF